MSRILIVEDEVAIADLEKDYLNSAALKLKLKMMGKADWRGP